MARLPAISGRDAVKAFEKDGWKVVRRAKSKHINIEERGDADHLIYPGAESFR